jgi:hypothetical protein
MHDSKQDVWDLLNQNVNSGDVMKKEDNDVTVAVRTAIQEFGKRFRPAAKN